MAKLGDYIREECHPIGSLGAQELRLIGVSNENGLQASSRATSADLSRYQRIEKNWFAYNPMRVNVGSIGLADDESKTGFTSPDYTVFSCREGLDPNYLLHFLKSDYGLDAIARNCSGAVRKRLYYSGLAEIELPVPSMEEQLAFVSRINHISETIRFICEQNSDRHELPMLKQAILQEAIQGKLTADWRAANPDVVPASQLLDQIQAEKDRLIAAKKFRKEKPLPKITPDEIPFDIPHGWEWCRLGNVTMYLNGYAFKSQWFASEGIRLVRNANVSHGVLDWSDTACIPASRLSEFDRFQLAEGDIVLSLDRPIISTGLKAARIKRADLPALLLQRVLRIEPVTVSGEYVFKWLFSPLFQGSINPGRSIGVPHVSHNEVMRSPIPIPPLAEQAAIVERVEELMATFRALEAEIEHARNNAFQLLQAVLKEAFAPAAV